MLVLTRRKNQSIVISDEVEVTIVEVRGNKVRLGITAPRSIAVHRREVYDAIKNLSNSSRTSKATPADLHTQLVNRKSPS